MATLGFAWLVFVFLLTIFGPMMSPYSYIYGNYLSINSPPSPVHIFGTDGSGRDEFTVLVYAARFSFEIACIATAISFVLGVTLGLVSGLSNRIVDQVLMRLTDFMFAFPPFYMAMILVVGLGANMMDIALSIGLVMWAGFARLARGLALSIRNTDLMESGIALGATRMYLARRYVFPMVVNSLIVYGAFTIANVIIQEAYLDTLGMGLQGSKVGLGSMLLLGGSSMFGFPWQFWPPTILFGLTLIALVLVGQGLQRALSPKGGIR